MEKVKFYTHYDPPAFDLGSEHYEEGTSMTIPDQVESVAQTVARCLRGEVLSSYTKPTYYENEGCLDEDEAFSRFDETSSAGFDLADVPSLLSGASAPVVAGGNDAETKKEQKSTESETKSNDSTDKSQE